MNRQIASQKMFGMVMVIVALLLVACGNGDGDADPTSTSAANEAVPTLPSEEATAQATGEISEEDLTVVSPDIPATAEASQDSDITDLTGVSTPVARGTPAAAETLESTPAESTAAESTSAQSPVVASTPFEPVAVESATPGTPEVAIATTPDATLPPATPDEATASSGTFNTAGDGTGGSGQPGERSSNTARPLASPAASPIAVVEVEGCQVTTVPPFTGTTTAYVTNAEVFFRQGPGTDCTPVYEVPLGEGQAVEVIGGPVSQAADGSMWLQVEVEGVPGWVSFEFAEPADEAP